jgi:signal transduction histidine kinase
LTALLGYCELLSQGKFGNVSEGQRELLDRMCYSSKRLGRLAGGALELLLQGRLANNTDVREANIEETLNQALHDIYPLTKDKRLHVDVQMTAPEEILLFEPEQMQQVFVNLLENSCKFTPSGGIIEIRGYPFFHSAWDGHKATNDARAMNAYRIDICDSGIGVPPGLSERIFEAYTSSRESNDRSGAGLGLAICKAILVAHGGVIWATPAAEGGKFSFILPTTPSKCSSSENYSRGIGIELERAAC